MTSPAPSDPQPDDATARRQTIARQRRQKLIQAALLIAVAIMVILIGSDARPSGTSKPLTPAESRWLTLMVLLGFGTIVLAVLEGITLALWPWRRRFVLRRGGLLGAIWIVAVLIWLPSPAGHTAILFAEVLILVIGAVAGGFLWRRQRKASQRDPTPEELEQAVALQQASAARNLGLNPTAAAGAYYNAALIEEQRGNLNEARYALDEALALYKATGNALMRANCLNVLGRVAGHEQPQRAPAYFEQALTLLRQEVKGRFRWQQAIGLDSNEAYELMFLNNAADAHLNLGQPAQALPLLEEALAIYHRTQEPRTMLSTLLINQARAHARLGHADQVQALVGPARAALDASSDLRPAQRAYLERMLDEILEPLPSGPAPADTSLPPERPVG